MNFIQKSLCDPTTGGQKLFWEEYHSINCIFIYDEVNKVLGETNAFANVSPSYQDLKSVWGSVGNNGPTVL